MTIYCQSDSLLLQFILSEFLAAYPEVRAMEGLYAGLKGKLLTQQLDDNDLSCLANALAALVGGVVEDTLPLPWTRTHGSLGKLKQYCQVYTQPMPELASVVADLQTAFSKSFHSVLLARELLPKIRMAANDERRIADIATLSRMLERLSANMSQGAQYLTTVLLFYRHDENILYFLLRRHVEFSELFHPRYVVDLVGQMFPGGIEEAGKFLMQRYHARGFHTVVSHIQHYLADLAT